MRRLMSRPMSLRRSPSTFPSSVITCRIFRTSSSDKSLTRVSVLTVALVRMSFERERPMPYIYVRPTSTRLFSGRSTPAIRAMFYSSWLSLTLLVFRVLADDANDALTAHDFALHTDLLDG